jgi:5'-nucleotidase
MPALGTDFHAVRANYVSITPLQVDLTRHGALGPLTEWLSDESTRAESGICRL